MTRSSADEQQASAETALIGVDWGTSSLRAYRLGSNGRILDSAHADKGILKVENGAFAETLNTVIGTWRTPGMPVILSGMIGSRQGWIEAPYLPIPATLDDLATALVEHPDDPDVHVVPGLSRNPGSLAPDVIRGEETQIAGAIGHDDGRHLLIMPGTHSKWVLVEHGKIAWFATFMTGELFALLKGHSILGRLMEGSDEQHDAVAFEQGARFAKSLPGGLLQRLFSARTLPLFGRLPPEAVAAYLSGLLVGSEINEALSNRPGPEDQASMTVIGASRLAQRYLEALALGGLSATKADDTAAARGHFFIGERAKLIAGSKDGSDDRPR